VAERSMAADCKSAGFHPTLVQIQPPPPPVGLFPALGMASDRIRRYGSGFSATG
jgi:hypothetical protein